jgi:hypothetical protein
VVTAVAVLLLWTAVSVWGGYAAGKEHEQARSKRRLVSSPNEVAGVLLPDPGDPRWKKYVSTGCPKHKEHVEWVFGDREKLCLQDHHGVYVNGVLLSSDGGKYWDAVNVAQAERTATDLLLSS